LSDSNYFNHDIVQTSKISTEHLDPKELAYKLAQYKNE